MVMVKLDVWKIFTRSITNADGDLFAVAITFLSNTVSV